jgi:hypothetical protein
MLYSYKNQYPKRLPHRIKFDDGTSRTDPSTFTEAEIAAAGYVAVESKPIVYHPEYVTWNGTAWVVQEYSFEQLRQEKNKELAAYRYEQEISHPSINTTRESQSMINAVWAASQIDSTILINFKNKDGSWIQLNAELIGLISRQVIAHVQQCFDNEKLLSEAINACTTTQELLAIDIRQGWPDYTIVNNEETEVLPEEE